MLCPATDDDEDLDVLDPAQLAIAHANQQQTQQTQGQQHHEKQQQQPLLYTHYQHCDSCRQHCGQQQGAVTLRSAAAEEAMLPPGWQLLDSNEQWDWQEGQQEEKLIRMDDPLFSTLSERKQKLMALEEILLNTGIEG